MVPLTDVSHFCQEWKKWEKEALLWTRVPSRVLLRHLEIFPTMYPMPLWSAIYYIPKGWSTTWEASSSSNNSKLRSTLLIPGWVNTSIMLKNSKWRRWPREKKSNSIPIPSSFTKTKPANGAYRFYDWRMKNSGDFILFVRTMIWIERPIIYEWRGQCKISLWIDTLWVDDMITMKISLQSSWKKIRLKSSRLGHGYIFIQLLLLVLGILGFFYIF